MNPQTAAESETVFELLFGCRLTKFLSNPSLLVHESAFSDVASASSTTLSPSTCPTRTFGLTLILNTTGSEGAGLNDLG